MEVTLTLTMEEVNAVLASLSKMPYEAVAPLVQKIVSQGELQIKGTEGTPKKELAEGA